MGRTVPTMTQIVAQEEASFAPFRRALRREDREILDRLFAAARQHAAPAAHMSRPVPFETILVAMLLEIAKQLYALVERREAHESPGADPLEVRTLPAAGDPSAD